ncbi:MAG: hypothetical protein AAGK22_25810 [Acidobacteriota bacterium]
MHIRVLQCARGALLVLMLFALFVAAPAAAQFEDLSNLIPDLLDRTIVLFPAGHEAHFVESSDALRDAGIQINRSIVGQLATFPLGTSSGGFTYTYNAELGIFERSTSSFGTVFGERGQTVGKGKWNFGFNVFTVDYDSIDDLDLRNGDINFGLNHLDTNMDGTTTNTFFEGDLVLADVALDLSTETAVFFGTYGITERFDVAFALPLVRVDLDARLRTRIDRIASSGFSDPPFHRFPDGSDEQSFFTSDTASGLGDVLVRGKYTLARSEGAAFAVALDLRLPTGDEEDLLGSGATQAKLFFISSGQFGRFSPYANFGYTSSSGGSDLIGDLSDEINFAAGFSVGLHERVTFGIDAVWRTLLDANQLSVGSETHLFRRHDEDFIRSTERAVLETATDDLNILLGAAGFKINVTGGVLISASVAFTLSDDGLRDEDAIPILGIDFSF